MTRETDVGGGAALLTVAKYSMSLHVPTSLHVAHASRSQASPAYRSSRQVQFPVASLQMPPAEHGTESPVRSPAVASSNHATPLSQSFGSRKNNEEVEQRREGGMNTEGNGQAW